MTQKQYGLRQLSGLFYTAVFSTIAALLILSLVPDQTVAQALHDRGSAPAAAPPSASAPRSPDRASGATNQRSERRWSTGVPRTPCDDYVGFQYDFEGLRGVGRADGQINWVRAIPECRAAVLLYPSEPRFAYMLGRAFVSGGQIDNARDIYFQAARAGYPPGLFGWGSVRIKFSTGEWDAGCRNVRDAVTAGYGQNSREWVVCR